jgi:hypothetical protein
MAIYNPFSWQVLFCIGLWAGKRHYIDGVPFRPRPWLQALCLAIVVAGYAAAFATRHADWLASGSAVLGWAIEAEMRTQIHPARLLNLLAAAYLVACYLRPDSRLATGQWTSPLRLCGRHSLEVFCAGVAVSIPGSVLLQPNNPLALELALTLGGFAIMTAVAQLLDGRRSERRRPPAPASRPLIETGNAQSPSTSGCGGDAA